VSSRRALRADRRAPRGARSAAPGSGAECVRGRARRARREIAAQLAQAGRRRSRAQRSCSAGWRRRRSRRNSPPKPRWCSQRCARGGSARRHPFLPRKRKPNGPRKAEPHRVRRRLRGLLAAGVYAAALGGLADAKYYNARTSSLRCASEALPSSGTASAQGPRSLPRTNWSPRTRCSSNSSRASTEMQALRCAAVIPRCAAAARSAREFRARR